MSRRLEDTSASRAGVLVIPTYRVPMRLRGADGLRRSWLRRLFRGR